MRPHHSSSVAIGILVLVPAVWLSNARANRERWIPNTALTGAPRPDLVSERADPSTAAPGKGAVAGDQYWSPDFNRRGVWGQVHAIGEDGGDLVIAGRFSFVGSTAASSIARWDGTAWRTYGQGVDTDSTGLVSAITTYDGHLVVGGRFGVAGTDSIRGVPCAYWDGTTWHELSRGAWQGVIADLEVYHSQLYASGYFWRDAERRGILVWDGTQWQSLGGPTLSGWGLMVRDDKLQVAASDIWVWDGQAWSQPYGQLAGGGLMTQAEWNGQLVAGGGSSQGGHVWLWNGAGWQELGGGFTGYPVEGIGDLSVVWSLAVRNGVLCAGGRFERTVINGQEVLCPYIADWTGDHWEALGGGTTRFVYQMANHGSDLVVGGWMAYAGHVDLVRYTGDMDSWGLALWNGTNYHGLEPVGKGLNGPVHRLGLYDDKLIAAGGFSQAGATQATNIAAFDGSSWAPLGSGIGYNTILPPVCSAMTEYEGDLIVAGAITRAGDSAVQHVARWDGQTWSPMGSGIPSVAPGLCVYNGTLYAGRYRWTGSEWEDFFLVDGDINALCVWNGLLIMAGTFSHVGLLPARHIAAWDGAEFSALGSGTDSYVTSLAVYGDDLAVGGEFMNPSYRVALWDGVSWHSLGVGMGTTVNTVTAFGDILFAGGTFEYAFNSFPGFVVNYVTYWDGASWRAMGSGCNEPYMYLPAVYGLAVYHGSLYVGGDYAMAGGRPSFFLGEWRDPSVPVYLRQLTAVRAGRTVTVRCEFGEAPASRQGERFEVWRSLPGQARTLLGQMPITGSTSLVFTDRAPPNSEADYWLREVDASGIAIWLDSAHLTAATIPTALVLSQSRPNPFNPKTTISYSLPGPGHVALAIYDQRGRLIRTLVDGAMPAGEQSVVWDGEDGRGRLVPSGTYVLRLVTEQGMRSCKLTLAR